MSLRVDATNLNSDHHDCHSTDGQAEGLEEVAEHFVAAGVRVEDGAGRGRAARIWQHRVGKVRLRPGGSAACELEAGSNQSSFAVTVE